MPRAEFLEASGAGGADNAGLTAGRTAIFGSGRFTIARSSSEYDKARDEG